MRRRADKRSGATAAALALLLALCATGCGGGGDRPRLVVSGASSLTQAFTRYGARFHRADVRLSFGGSDQLAAQLRAGAAPDVFAAANMALPDALYADGLIERPVAFATNRLVLAVPAGTDARVGGLADLTRSGVTIAIGSATVPIGAYTRTVLGRLGAARARAVLAHVRTSEPDVAGIVGKLEQGAVDAGFVYVTDVAATNGKLRAIELPGRLLPRVVYGVAIVKGTRHRAQARAFVAGLLNGEGAAALRDAGFEPPPR